MDAMKKPSATLFDVFLRLRPSSATSERFLDVERAGDDNEECPTHITIKPPASDYRKRAIERFAFTQVFEEHASQRDLLDSTGALGLLEGVLGAAGREGRDGLLATLGVTGSGKSLVVDLDADCSAYPSLCASDLSEAQIVPAANFFESVYSDAAPSRGATPALVRSPGSLPLQTGKF
nr:hypothetical protein CFP56_10459 [Quercus suber]